MWWVCVWEWLRGVSRSAVTVGPTPSCSFCIYWKSFKPETFPSNLTPIDSQVPPRSSDLSSETSLSLDGSRCSPRCCFRLLFSLSLHFYLAAYIFNDVLRSRTWMIKHHIMKLRVWRRAFSVKRLALNVGGWILKWKSCLYVCENIYILSFFLISHIAFSSCSFGLRRRAFRTPPCVSTQQRTSSEEDRWAIKLRG